MNDAILCQSSRERVETGDTSDYMKRFGHCRLPVGAS